MVNMPLLIHNFVSEIDETAHQSKVLRLHVQEERQRRDWTPALGARSRLRVSDCRRNKASGRNYCSVSKPLLIMP